MVTRYHDLTEDDIEKLKRIYCVGYKDQELDKKETDFLINYRKKLYDSMLYLWEYKHTGKEELNGKAMQGIIEVSNILSEYMTTVTSGNVRQRILFINKIDKELGAVNTAIQWGLHKYSVDCVYAVLKDSPDISNFLKYISTKALTQNRDFEKMLADNSKLQVKSLKNKLKKNFLNFIDLDNISFYDNYFLIGASLNKIEEIKDKQKAMEQERCDSCKVDDCAISRCNVYIREIELEREINAYKKIVSICGNLLGGKNCEDQEIEKIQELIKDEKIIKSLKKLRRVPPIETRNDRIKKINVEMLTKMPELIDSENIQELLANFNIIPAEKKYYEDINLIASSLLLTRCDYGQARGKEEFDKFYKWNKDIGKNFEKEKNVISYAGKLLKLYEDKIKEDKENY